MRHGKKFNHLGRTATHRKAMLSNMASSLIIHKRITTTLAKARELRKYIEPLITKAKDNTTHNRRIVFSYLANKEAVSTLFGEVAEKVANRPGGYTRILKLVNRYGDNAEMAIIELVDYNELMLAAKAEKKEGAKAGTRRSRRGGSSAAPKTKAEVAAATVVETEAEVTEVVAESTETVVDSSVENTTDATTDESSQEEKKD